MEKWLTTILKNPQTGNGFEYNENTNTLIDYSNHQSFPIINNIPVIIQENTPAGKSNLHDNLNTQFNYVDHYEKDAEIFDYFSDILSKSSRVEEKLLRKHILSEITKDAGLILDVGCGSAWLAGELVKKGKNVVSLDVSLINTTKALEKISAPNHAAVTADVYNLPFGENTFDCIAASEIMEHLCDPLLFVQKLIYVLKPGGKLIVTTPYKEVLEYSLCVHCNKPTPKNAHIHSFDEKKMFEMVQKLDVENVKIRTFNNKLLVKLRLHILISSVSFNLWKLKDKIACKLFSRALRIMTVFLK